MAHKTSLTSDQKEYIRCQMAVEDRKLAEERNKLDALQRELEGIDAPEYAQVDKKIFCCPRCGSISIKDITTVKRAASVVAFGLASGKIGKQYECKNCHHEW